MYRPSLTLLNFSPSCFGNSERRFWKPALMLCIRLRSLLLAISRRIRFSFSSVVLLTDGGGGRVPHANFVPPWDDMLLLLMPLLLWRWRDKFLDDGDDMPPPLWWWCSYDCSPCIIYDSPPESSNCNLKKREKGKWLVNWNN